MIYTPERMWLFFRDDGMFAVHEKTCFPCNRENRLTGPGATCNCVADESVWRPYDFSGLVRINRGTVPIGMEEAVQ